MFFDKDRNNYWLFIAPHFESPAQNGADLLVEKNARELSYYVENIDILGMNEIITYSKGDVVSNIKFENKYRPKSIAALRTILFGSHYLYEKFITQKYINMGVSLNLSKKYSNIIYSYLSALQLSSNFDLSKKNSLVYTHNDEFKWFENISTTTKSLLIKLACKNSLKYLKTISVDEVILIHVSENDRKGFNKYYPNHKAVISTVGTDLIPIKNNNSNFNKKGEKIILTFVGSLNVKMNFDALMNFSEKFYPKIKHRFEDKIKIRIVGSNPSLQVIDFCKKYNWELFMNVSDEKLSELLEESTFGILPFSYSTGAKLKQLTYLGHGLPFLATECIGSPDENEIPKYCIVSDDPEKWVRQIEILKLYDVDSEEILNSLQSYVQKFSWSNVVHKLILDLKYL